MAGVGLGRFPLAPLESLAAPTGSGVEEGYALPEAELAPLDTASLRDRARRSIRASIVAGEVEAGRIYPVAHFVAKLGVSATPIREALFDLAGAGIVQAVRNRGFMVPVLDEEDLDQLLDLRMLLERPAVVRLVRRGTLGDPAPLRALADEVVACARAGDVLSFLAADRRLHGELLRRAGNPRLTAIVMNLRDQVRLYGLSRLAEAGVLVQSALIHIDLLTALEAGDPDEVDRQMERHLLHTRGDWAGAGKTADLTPEAGHGSDHEASRGPAR